MRIGLFGLVILVLILAAVMQNVYIGGVGAIVLIVVLVLFLTDRL